jgi:hypothetical protein
MSSIGMAQIGKIQLTIGNGYSVISSILTEVVIHSIVYVMMVYT